MADFLVNSSYNLMPAQASSLNIPKNYYTAPNGSKGDQTNFTFVDRDAVFTPSMQGGLINISANDAEGKVISYECIVNTVVNSTTLTLNLSANIQNASYIIWYGGFQADQNGTVSFNRAYVNGLLAGTLFTQDITITAAQLAGNAQVVLFTAPDATTQYKIRDIRVNYGNTGLVGGNRLLLVKDSSIPFNGLGITSALLLTPTNTVWGGTGNPLSPNVPFSTPTVAGSNIYAQTSGGTTDYTSGSITLTISVDKVA